MLNFNNNEPPSPGRALSAISPVKEIFNRVRSEARKKCMENWQAQMKNCGDEVLSMDKVHAIQEANEYGYTHVLACELIWLHNLLVTDTNGASETEIVLIFARRSQILGRYSLYTGGVRHKMGSSDNKNFVYLPVPHHDADTLFVVVKTTCNIIFNEGHATRRSSRVNSKEVVYHGVHVCHDLNKGTWMKKWLSVAAIPVFSADDNMAAKLNFDLQKTDIWMRSYRMMNEFADIIEGAENECTVACLHVEFVLERRNSDWDVVQKFMDTDRPTDGDDRRIEFIAYQRDPQPDGLSVIRTELLCSTPLFFSPFYEAGDFGTLEALVDALNKKHRELLFREVKADLVSVTIPGAIDSFGKQLPSAYLPDRAVSVPMPAYIPVHFGGETAHRVDPRSSSGNILDIMNQKILRDLSIPEKEKAFMVFWNTYLQKDKEKHPIESAAPGYLAKVTRRCVTEKAAELRQKDWDLPFLTMVMQLQKYGHVSAQDYTDFLEIISLT